MAEGLAVKRDVGVWHEVRTTGGTMSTTVETTPVADPLQEAIVRQSRQGWRVTSQSATQATLVKGKPTNHILHLILSIITVGLWIPVWILIAIFGGEKHEVITVQPDGRVLFSG